MYLQTNTILLLKITTSRGPKKTRLLYSSFSPTITTYQKSKRKNLMHFSNNILAYNIIPSEAAASECVCVCLVQFNTIVCVWSLVTGQWSIYLSKLCQLHPLLFVCGIRIFLIAFKAQKQQQQQLVARGNTLCTTCIANATDPKSPWMRESAYTKFVFFAQNILYTGRTKTLK
jgi:uncharacterized membrane protein YhfC